MHVYRTAGRAADPVAIPLPSARTLWAPLLRGTLFLVVTVAPPCLFNVLVPKLLPGGTSLVPTFDFVQDVIAAAMLGSVVVLSVAVVRRVRPSWGGLSSVTKSAYVVGLLFAQLALTAGAELLLFQSRGGLKLFEPHLESTQVGPDGRTAFVYKDAFFSCDWTAYVAEPYSPVMRYAVNVSRATCAEPVPSVSFEPDHSIVLRGADGTRLESQSTPSFFPLFGGGC